MAYNANMYMPQFGYGYQQTMPPMPYSGYQQQQQAAQPVNGRIDVTGIDGAKAYPLPPNSRMPLFDDKEDILYYKTTDAAGYPTIKAFRFEPMEQSSSSGYQQGDFVTRSEYDELCERVNALEGQAPRTRSTRKAAGDE